MASSSGGAPDNPLLRGLFGSLQAAAQQGGSTAEVWDALRTAAGTWQFAAQGAQQPYDPVAVTEAGRAILQAQGVDAAAVSSFRGIAGSWLGAKQSLARLGQDQQITAANIYVPPWSITNNAEVPSRYRIRTQWQITPAAGDVFTKWTSNELTGPLTDVESALGQAAPRADTTSGKAILASQDAPTLLDYSIEQI